VPAGAFEVKAKGGAAKMWRRGDSYGVDLLKGRLEGRKNEVEASSRRQERVGGQ
jgi:hypothetical protein